jgi:Tol biopolymer transport system component
VYLPDGRLVYVTEHVMIDQSWTDLWTVDPTTNVPRTELATQVQAQGPFEFSSDARQLLFASPRSGNFEIYSVTLDAAGKAELATKPQRISPDLTSAASTQERGFSLPSTAEPYVLAVGLLAFAVVGVESIIRARRRARVRTKP